MFVLFVSLVIWFVVVIYFVMFCFFGEQVHTKFHCRQAHASGTDTSCLTFSYDGTVLASRGGRRLKEPYVEYKMVLMKWNGSLNKPHESHICWLQLFVVEKKVLKSYTSDSNMKHFTIYYFYLMHHAILCSWKSILQQLRNILR